MPSSDRARRASALALCGYRGVARARDKAFSLAVGHAFAEFGPRSVIALPVRISGEAGIHVGADVYVGAGSWLQTLEDEGGGRLEIGDGCAVSGHVVLSAARSVVLGRRVLVARGVYIGDHRHAFDDPARAVMDQGLAGVAAVRVGDGAWLGENAVVCPGVTIGAGAVVGANSVVTRDVAPATVVAGSPARVLRELVPA